MSLVRSLEWCFYDTINHQIVPFVLVPWKLVKLSKHTIVWFWWVEKNVFSQAGEENMRLNLCSKHISLRQMNFRKEQVWKICTFISLKLSKLTVLFFLPVLYIPQFESHWELTKTKGINFAFKPTYQCRVLYAQKKLSAMYSETYNAHSFYTCQRIRLKV